MTKTETGVALYCVPDAIPASERAAHFERARRLLRLETKEWRELANGYAFCFRAEAFDDVAKFVTNERKCCPFLTFELTVAADAGPVWLTITGPEGAREVLRAELDLARPCSCC